MRRAAQDKCHWKNCGRNALRRRLWCGLHAQQRRDRSVTVFSGADMLLNGYERLDVLLVGGTVRPPALRVTA